MSCSAFVDGRSVLVVACCLRLVLLDILCWLMAVLWLLFAMCLLLFVACCLLLAICSSMRVACCALFVACCWLLLFLFVRGLLLFVVRRSWLRFACWLLLAIEIARCSLLVFVVCCFVAAVVCHVLFVCGCLSCVVWSLFFVAVCALLLFVVCRQSFAACC